MKYIHCSCGERHDIDNKSVSLIKAKNAGRKQAIEDIKKIITDEFYKLEEIEKDFKINQEIIRTRNKIIKLLK